MGRGRIHKLIKPIAIGLVAGVCLITVIAFLAARAVPSWWPVLDGTAPSTNDSAANFENTVVDQSHRVRPLTGTDATWTLSLDEDLANAWLAARLPKWLASTVASISGTAPAWFQSARVRFDEGAITLGLAVVASPNAAPTYIDASFVPTIDSLGDLELAPERMHVGRMPLPIGMVVDQVRSHTTAERDTWLSNALARLANGGAAILRPRFRLADHRVVRIVDIAVHDRVLTLTCTTGFDN